MKDKLASGNGPATLARAAAIGSVVLGGVVLAGWWLEVAALRQLWPGRPHMTANAALVFVLLGTALWLVSAVPLAARPGTRCRVGQSMALLAATVGLVTLAEHLLGWDAGIDQWLVSDPVAATRQATPGRPSYPLALNALGVGLGIALLEVRFRRVWLSDVLAVMTMQIALLALIGHVFGLPALYGSVRPLHGTGMALHGAAGFLLLGAGLRCARAERGLMAVLRSQTAGGILARRLMLTPAVVLLVMGVVYLILHRAAPVERAIGTWALLMTNSIVWTLLIWATAHVLHRASLEREEAQRTLEGRVSQRTTELNQANEALRAEVAERSRAEARLREERDFSEALVDSLPGVFYLINAEGRFLRWNRNFEQLSGYSAAEIAWLHPVDFFLGDDQHLIAERMEEVFAHGEATAVVELTSSDGIQRSYLLTGVRVALPQGPCLMGMGIDITERTRAEEALSKSEARFRLLVSEVRDYAIFMLDLEGRVVSWNAGAERVKGYRAEEILGQSFSRFYPPEAVEEGKPERELQAAIIEGRFQNQDWHLRKDGSRFWADAVITAIHDDSGRHIGFSKITRDLTERKRVEQALQEAKAQLARANKDLERTVEERTAHLQETIRSLETICYNIAHDLRAPNRAMSGFAEALLTEYSNSLDATGREYAERIAAAARRGDALILDLLAYGRLGHADLPCSAQSLKTHLQTVLQKLARDIAACQASIEVSGPLPEVWANPTALEQVLTNLLSNALKFVPEGVQPQISIWAEEADDLCRVCVRDNGLGIPPEHQEKVFGVFERLHPPEKYPGTGIGLAIVQKCVQRMRGKVGVESTPGKGSCFWFELCKA